MTSKNCLKRSQTHISIPPRQRDRRLGGGGGFLFAFSLPSLGIFRRPEDAKSSRCCVFRPPEDGQMASLGIFWWPEDAKSSRCCVFRSPEDG